MPTLLSPFSFSYSLGPLHEMVPHIQDGSPLLSETFLVLTDLPGGVFPW